MGTCLLRCTFIQSVLISTVLFTVLADTLSFNEQWNAWKTKHGRSYATSEQEMRRQKVWLSNADLIEEHNRNAEQHGYWLEMNQFSDLTGEEYLEQVSCYTTSNSSSAYQEMFQEPNYSLPDAVDWRTKQAVTPVKDQDQCGACYAFSATGALEGAHALAHNDLVSLSEQNIIDCSVPYGNHGCNGGNVQDAYRYIIDNGGLDTEDSYHYQGKQGPCHFNRSSVGAKETGSIIIQSGNEADLMSAVATAGPVSVGVDASSNSFRFYAGGIFDEPNCSTQFPNHYMLVIGYGTSKSKDYWIVKNSWGVNWGMDGYILMARGKANQCGIATDASFPTL